MLEDMKVFPREREAVEWLGESGFLNVVFDPQLKGGWLKHVGLRRRLAPNCSIYLNPIGLNETEIRNYVKAFEIDYISVRDIGDPGMRPPFGGESTTREFAGVEAKYFYASSLKNTKYHTGVGQLFEYLKWGLDSVALVHIFDSDLGETKINNFRRPAFRLISGLRDMWHMPIEYFCLIENEKRYLHSSLDKEYSVWGRSRTEQNPFKTDHSSIIIRESIETNYSRNFR